MRTAPTLSPAFPRITRWGIVALIGFTATVAQIVLMRELMIVSYGNEISLGLMLASWLFWTAFGSGLLSRIFATKSNPATQMAALQIVLAMLFPATILAARGSRTLFHALPGELLGPVAVSLITFLILSCFCAVSGWMFVVGVQFHASESAETAAMAVNSVYLLEAAGSAVGGILASVLLLRLLNALQIAFLVGALNLVAAAVLSLHKHALRFITVLAIAAAWIILALPAGRYLENYSLSHLWPGFQVLETKNSVYGNLAVVETGGIRSLLENGLVMFHAPDQASAEEAVHFALLEHPSPRRLLLIGGGAGGALLQALQHPSLERVDYVELDSAVFQLAERYFPEYWTSASTDPRVHIHVADGRLFLKSTRQLFDVIIVNLPAPQTAQLNRFYTADFFREASQKLSADGVFSFHLHAAEEYLSPDLSAFLRCIFRTLNESFPVVQTIPGDNVHFFAAKRNGVLADSTELLSRLRSRRLKTEYVREYYIPFRLMPDRIADLEQNIHPLPETPVNRDLAPIAYYFDVELWSTQFERGYQHVFESVARIRFARLAALCAGPFFAIAAVIFFWPRSSTPIRAAAGFCAALTGLTMMSLEVMLLLGFQVIYGYVYHQLAILIALFMTGMALGNWWRLSPRGSPIAPSASRSNMVGLAVIQVLVALSPLLLYLFLNFLENATNTMFLALTSKLFFPAMALLGGVLGGYEFALATEVFFDDVECGLGTLYGVDLIGACVGALFLSMILLPLFGFLKAALFIAMVNLPAALLALGSGWGEAKTRPA